MIDLTRRRTLQSLGAVAGASALGLPGIARGADKTVVGALRFTSHAPTFVAKERGYFKEAGLNVDLKFFQAAQPMAVAIASRDADYAVTAITGGLISLADKGAVQVIGGALEESKGVNGQKILAANKAYEAGLTDPGKLDGATYGMTQAGSSFHYMGAQIAAAEGADVSFKPLQKVGAIIGAIKTGQIDAWSIVPHIAEALAGGGAVQIIGDVVDYLPNYQVTTAFTSPRNVTQDSAKTQAFIEAFAKGARDYNAALVDRTEGEDAAEEMVRLIHNYVYTDRPYEKAAPSIRAGAMRISEGAALNMASIENQLAWFKSEGLVPGGITLDRLVDPRFVETT